ncbi:MAG: DNA-binding response regulator [Ignavibacteriales bacterium]|nr:MAG: DNA-binding response regulator [Ignavibacteriales bacterium]
MKKILVIEDDPAILQGLELSLKDEHFIVSTAEDGEKGFNLARKNNYDIIILDLMLPKKNGMEVCSLLRAEKVQTPIIILTSKKDEIDKIIGLETGADDYVTKPFSTRELLARIKAVIRRNEKQENELSEFSFGKINIDFKKQEVTKNKKLVDLSVTEFRVLKYMVEHEDQVVTREILLNEIWGYDTFPTTRTVDNYILSLRKKIEDDSSEPRFIITAPKAGYRFRK